MSKQTLPHNTSYKAYIHADHASQIPEYVEKRKKDITLVENALKIGAFDKIRAIGKNMKRSGAGFGFEPISQTGQTLEEAALKKNQSSILSSIDDLSDYLLHVHITYQEE